MAVLHYQYRNPSASVLPSLESAKCPDARCIASARSKVGLLTVNQVLSPPNEPKRVVVLHVFLRGQLSFDLGNRHGDGQVFQSHRPALEVLEKHRLDMDSARSRRLLDGRQLLRRRRYGALEIVWRGRLDASCEVDGVALRM